MKKIGNCEIRDKLYESHFTIIYRAKDNLSGKEVIVKTLKSDYPQEEEITAFLNEYSINRELSDETVKALYFGNEKNKPYIVFEYFRAQSLKDIITEKKLSIPDFLEYALKISELVENMHKNNIIHKDINPSNILMSIDKNIFKIIDFSISSKLEPGKKLISDSENIEGTLNYMAPEQTGILNRSIGYETDLYSLGISFYEMLTDQLPFKSNDPLELIHAHISKTPSKPSSIRKGIPEALDRIILKLISKNKEERYRTAYGLKQDIEKCITYNKKRGFIPDFEIAKEDYLSQFKLSEKLYGIDNELKKIEEYFEKTNKGIYYIEGKEGTGKSSLARELNKIALNRKACFLTGRCSHENMNSPYNIFKTLFKDLVKVILSMEKSTVEKIKERIDIELQDGVKFINHVIPMIGLLSDKLNNEHDKIEDKKSFYIYMSRFLKIAINFKNPIFIFIDNTSYIDKPSFELINFIMGERSIRNIYFILTYSPKNLEERSYVTNLQKSFQYSKTVLRDLGEDEIEQLLIDSFKSEQNYRALASLVLEKTGGKQFFVHHFLSKLYDNKYIYFDKESHFWKWELAYIKEEPVTENIVSLVLESFFKLSNDLKRILKKASCIGNKFDLEVLAEFIKEDPKKIVEILDEAVLKGIISIEKDYQKIYRDFQNSKNYYSLSDFNIKYRFSHLRIQSAIYDFIEKKKKEEIHYELAKFLVERDEGDIFELAYHYNKCESLIINKELRNNISEINYRAGLQAKQRIAYGLALDYFNKALSFFDKDENKKDEYYFDLKLEKAKCEYLNTNFDEAEKLFDDLIDKSWDKYRTINVYKTKMTLYINKGETVRVAELAQEALALLNEELPLKQSMISLGFKVASTVLELKMKKAAGIRKMPEMDNREKLEVLQILMQLTPAASLMEKEFFIAVLTKMISISFQYGNSRYTPFAYGVYGILLAKIGFIDDAYDIGVLSRELARKYGDKGVILKCDFNFGWFINNWKKPIKEGVEILKETVRKGIDQGELVYTAYSKGSLLLQQFSAGENLSNILEDLKADKEYISSLKIEDVTNLLKVLEYNIEEIQGKRISVNKEKLLKSLINTNMKPVLGLYYLFEMRVLYAKGEYKEAFKYGQKISKARDNMEWNLTVEFITIFALVLVKMYELRGGINYSVYLKRAEKYTKKIYKWAKKAPENLMSRYYIMRAEISRVKGEDYKAREFYDKSIEEANKNGLIQIEAFVNEIAADFYKSRNREKYFKIHMKEAFYCYKRWGAFARAKYLKLLYTFLDEESVKVDMTSTIKNIDLISVIRMSQVISGEIDFENLQHKLIKILLENSGAQYVVLVLKEKENFVIKARGDEELIETNLSENFEESSSIPNAIPNYVLRTSETLILNVENDCKGFCEDDYFAIEKPRSILCTPLVNKKETKGIIYLENKTIKGGFTEERVKLMEMIASQIAASVENALLYKNIESSEEKYRMLVDNIKDGVFIVQDAKIKFVNRAFLDIVKYNEEIVNNKNIFDIVSGEYLSSLVDAYIERVNNQDAGNYETEIEIINGEGKKVPVIITLAPIEYEGARAIEGSIKDITQRKNMEKLKEDYRKQLEQQVEERTRDIKNLLDNTEQGFLTFERDLIINKDYSRECIRILGSEPSEKDFVDTVFKENKPTEKEVIERTLNNLFQSIDDKDPLKTEVYISLLPEKIKYNKRYLTIEYKIINEKNIKVMVIITDITEKKELERKMNEEQKNLKMIVSVVVNNADLKQMIRSYYRYFKVSIFHEFDKMKDMYEIFRKVHNFKGNFAQYNFYKTAEFLHGFEESLSILINKKADKKEYLSLFANSNFFKSIDKEIAIIDKNLGENFLRLDDASNLIIVDNHKIKEIEKEIKAVMTEEHYKIILNKIKKLRYRSIKDMMKNYPYYSKELAQRLGKEINDFDIEGDDIFIDPEVYDEFFKSLVHIFRNIVDHGIEYPDERMKKGKDSKGKIRCKVKYNSGKIALQISDDGAGIDFEKLKRKLSEKEIISNEEIKEISEKELKEHIFKESISTKSEVNELSGRGVGLVDIKREIEKLNGSIAVETAKDKGTEFHIELSFKD